MSAFGIDINPSAIRVYNGAITKHDSLDRLVDAIASQPDVVSDVEAFRRAVLDRESIMSTGIGSGVAIPHVRMDAISWPTVGVAVSHFGIDFDTLDNEPVNIIVLFAMPSGSQKQYLSLLAQVMLALKTPGFRERLMACETPEEAAAILNAPVDAAADIR